MCINSYCSLINVWSILIASLVFFVLGSIWYAPFLFGKAWLEESKVVPDKSKMAKLFISTFIITVFMVHALALLIGVTGAFSLIGGLKLGLLAGLGFTATSIGVTFMYEGRSIKLFLIDAGYHVVGLLASGAIIGMWGR